MSLLPMWSEDDFSSDLIKIRDKNYSALSAMVRPMPEDARLRWRYQLVLLLSAFEQNDFARQREMAESLVDPLWLFITSFDESYLTSEKDSPPFDLFLLVFMIARKQNAPSHNLLIGLFQYYQNMAKLIKEKSDIMWFLNDRNLRKDAACDRTTAQRILQTRMDYLAEVVASLLYTNGQYQLLQAFLADLCPPGFTTTEETLSHLGRVAIATGDGGLAAKYFDGVQDECLKSANAGYKNFFDGVFDQAKRDFQNARQRGPRNIDACSRHMGSFDPDTNDPSLSPRREGSEEKTQWPAHPKVKM